MVASEVGQGRPSLAEGAAATSRGRTWRGKGARLGLEAAGKLEERDDRPA